MILYIILAVLVLLCCIFAYMLFRLYRSLAGGMVAASRGVFDKKLFLPRMLSHEEDSGSAEKAQLEQEQELISELQQMNSQLEQLVSRRTAELQQAYQARLNLQANLAHDLRAPLTSIQGYVEALMDGVASSRKEQERYLAIIYTRVLAMNRLLRELFELSRWEEGQLNLERQPIFFLGWLHQVCGKYGEDFRMADLELVRPFESNKSLVAEDILVSVDTTAMDRVWANIFMNSIRHTPSGGVITVGAQLADDGKVIVSIDDTGPGVTPEQLPSIFDRYWQGRGTAARGSGGLGLYIAKEIITLHGGHIWAESSSDQGMKIRFTLPVSCDEAENSKLVVAG